MRVELDANGNVIGRTFESLAEAHQAADELAVHFGYTDFKAAWAAKERGALDGTIQECELKMWAHLLGWSE